MKIALPCFSVKCPFRFCCPGARKKDAMAKEEVMGVPGREDAAQLCWLGDEATCRDHRETWRSSWKVWKECGQPEGTQASPSRQPQKGVLQSCNPRELSSANNPSQCGLQSFPEPPVRNTLCRHLDCSLVREPWWISNPWTCELMHGCYVTPL